MESFRSFQDISVELIGSVPAPYEVSVASARTCYSGRGIVYPGEVSKDEKAVELRDRIAASTLEAGHLTTRQHAHFTFAVSGVSRQFLWSFLHAHPFYNSEQVSQRYVKVKPGNFLMPPLPEAAARVFADTVLAQTEAYEKLITALRAPISADFYERFPARRKLPERWEKSIDKRVYEVARYALGVGTTAYLYHTVSALTLLRYAKLVRHFDTPDEQRVVVDKMLACVAALDPLFEKELRDPIPLEQTPEYAYFGDVKPSDAYAREFDADMEGRCSKLISYTNGAEAVLADSVRGVLGRARSEMSDDDAMDLVLDPKRNVLLADTLNPATLGKLSQVLKHVSFTFKKKLSHTADSQDQRHRMVPASRPVLRTHYAGKADYVTPFGITQSDEAMALYERVMEKSFSAVNRLLEMGVDPQHAFYCLPNSVTIRLVSTGDLQSLQHKWKLRTCYNAQEEIFRASLEEITQVRAVFPKLAQHMRAPCYLRLRAGLKPYCPEGDRFCGIPVWKLDTSQYARKSL